MRSVARGLPLDRHGQHRRRAGMAAGREGFVRYVDPSSGHAYFYNPTTHESVWEEATPTDETLGSGKRSATDDFEPVWASTTKMAVDVRVDGGDADAAQDADDDGDDDASSESETSSSDDHDDDDDDEARFRRRM